MKKIYINGLGVVAGSFSDFETLTSSIQESKGYLPERVAELPKISNKIAMRKMDRFSKLAVLSSARALKDAGVTDCEHVGTIFSSVFGPLNTNIKFAQYVADKNVEEASPTLFTNTVNNACVGYVCMELQCKGVSTMLLASNYVGYASQLLMNGKAQTILAGGVEEYSEDVFTVLSKTCHTAEGAAVLVLQTIKTPHTYAEILGYYEAFLGIHPYYQDSSADYEQKMEHIICAAMENAKVAPEDITGILLGTQISSMVQNRIFQKLFTIKKENINTLQTDALGANLGLKLGIASILLRQQTHTAFMVTELDFSGVYRVYILGKADR